MIDFVAAAACILIGIGIGWFLAILIGYYYGFEDARMELKKMGRIKW